MKNFIIKSATATLLLTSVASIANVYTPLSHVHAAETVVKEYKQTFPSQEEYNTKGKLYNIADINLPFPVENAEVIFEDGSSIKFDMKAPPGFEEENQPITQNIKEIVYNGAERGVTKTIQLKDLDNLDPKSFTAFYHSIFFEYPTGTKTTLILENGKEVHYTIGDPLESTGIDNDERIIIKKAIIEKP
ncbi:hypothetical protein NQ043_00040 [Staphylococcus hyicus]|uniref:hypothetical protein n=1 Tax=Staphylococcus hyicus TaxID=1284 RepID=UPI00211D158A|nr:hypothetical protein [Staphylococcus hyicus]MCQ9299536.1 hypothetical protein [Staphylococcus hyicus]